MLADGTRVLAQRGLQSGIGISEGGGKTGARRIAELMVSLAEKGVDVRGLVARANSGGSLTEQMEDARTRRVMCLCASRRRERPSTEAAASQIRPLSDSEPATSGKVRQYPILRASGAGADWRVEPPGVGRGGEEEGEGDRQQCGNR